MLSRMVAALARSKGLVTSRTYPRHWALAQAGQDKVELRVDPGDPLLDVAEPLLHGM